MWWRATSLMTEDVKQPSEARLPKGFYRGGNPIQGSQSGRNSEAGELCETDRTLISYKDVTLPDKLYGGRNKKPCIVTDDKELLRRKIIKELNTGPLEFGIAIKTRESEANTKVKGSVHISQQKKTALLEELRKIEGDYSKMKVDYENLENRNTVAETEIRRLSLIKEESDLAHREEADALRNTIEGLNKQLATAREEVEAMGVDITECVVHTTSQLKQHFDVLLAEAKEHNQVLLAEKEAKICEKDAEVCEIKKYFERELDAVKEQGVKRLERMRSIEKEKSELEQINAQTTQLVELSDKKAVIKKKLFKATKEMKEANERVIQGREEFNKQQQELDDLNTMNEKLIKDNEEERKKHIEELTRKKSELVKTCDSFKEQINVKEQNMGLLKGENEALKLAQVECDLTHAAEMAKKNEALLRAKNAHMDEISEAKEQIDQFKKEASQMDLMHQKALAAKDGNLKESQLTIGNLQKEKLIGKKKLETASNSVLRLEKRLNQREVEILARLEDISAHKKKANADKATIEKQKVSMEKMQNNLKREKNRIESLIRERNAYREEAHTNSMKKIEINKKLESTKEHLQKVKKEYECKIAQMQPIQETEAVGKQKQKKRKRKSKQAVSTNDIKVNTLTVPAPNKSLPKLQEAKGNNPNQASNGKIKKVAKVQKSSPQRKSPSRASKDVVNTSDAIFDQHDNERPWSLYDTSLVTFCIGIWFLLIKVCSIVTNDDSLW